MEFFRNHQKTIIVIIAITFLGFMFIPMIMPLLAFGN